MSRRSPADSRAVLVLLAGLAVVAVAVRLTSPALSADIIAPLLAVGSGATAVVVARHAARLPGRSGRPWQALALAAGLLAVGRATATLRDAGIEAGAGGIDDLPQLLAVPLAIAACVLLMPPGPARGTRSRVLLDGGIVLLAVAVGAEIVLADVLGRTATMAEALISVGYPAVGALLCAMAVVTLVRVPPVRRRAAGWLLAAVVAMAVVAVSGALARLVGSAAADVVTQVSWLAMLAAGIRAVDGDPGEPAAPDEQQGTPPLLALLLSSGATYGIGLVVALQPLRGEIITAFEAGAIAVLMPILFVRTMLWTVDAARVTGRLQRTEEYLRALVHSAEDVTVVLDGAGTVVWASGAVRAQLSWSLDELTGRSLPDLVHADDRPLLDRMAAAVGRGAPVDLPATLRLRTREDGWQDVEVSGAVRAGVPGTTVREGLVLHLRDVTQRRSTERELERLAYTDYLTGLPNRARIMADLATARETAAAGHPACLLLLDLDGFKPVNDIAGHEAGDQLLVEIAARLRTTVRDGDLVGRLGGDEFAVLVHAGAEESTALAERIVENLRAVRPVAPATVGRGELIFDVSASIGVAELDPSDDVSTTIRQADLALRAAKAAGKDCVRRHGDASDTATARRTRLARDLPEALEQNQLRVVYQPVVGLEERRVLGLEALVRWEHPLLGSVPPDEFISLAEDDGLIVSLQRFVLQTATRDVAALVAAGRDIKVSVNVSVLHLQAGCLAPDVAQALASSGLPARSLILEITESVALDAEDRLEGDLAVLREMGCAISLDDFGRGWSSLAYLARLPADILKMDREFVAGIEDDPRVAMLVAAVIDLGRSLGMDVVAEGIETPEQLVALKGMGCRYMQGYLLGRPMGVTDAAAAIADFDPRLLDGAGTVELDTSVH